jgi:hypothetical protein
MARLQPWYKVVTPREDLREGKPLDAAEFAVHLDQVRDRRGSEEYFNPARFFERTFLTHNLANVASQVLRRLSGEKSGTSAVFNMATQFGGGKTHALTLLYHLSTHGPKASKWFGVDQILEQARIAGIPRAATAVFVGTEFDSIAGRGGDDGTPLRKTPWGEIAFQLGGQTGFEAIAAHEDAMTSPAGDVIRRFLPADRPSLILIDELLNYVSRNRRSGLSTQLYSFIQNLAEEARARDDVVLVVSIPASELEMTAEDQSDYERFKKLLDRVGKAVVMSAETETSEIIRRRLFEWDMRAVGANGRVLLPRDASTTAATFAEWLNENRTQFPAWFPADHARQVFESTYPFHPVVLSVFERKWQELPRFQQTRGVLRLLAMWVSAEYQRGFKGASRDPLIGLGTAPLHDSFFRSAVFEQLGETRLEGAVTTDIGGRKDSHAIRLDQEAVDTIKKANLHQKVATSIFFESNGGQTRSEATVPEIRLAVAGPEIDLGNVETALEGLTEACYYLTSERNRYSFGLRENLNKRFADRRASVRDQDIDARVKEEIQRVFSPANGIDRKFFPEKSAQVADVPALSFVIVGPEHSLQEDPDGQTWLESMTKEHGKAARTFKSALIWVVPDSASTLREEARKLLAWEDIRDEGLKLDEAQIKHLEGSIQKARRDLTESVWRSYKNVLLLGKDNTLEIRDLGLVTSSAAETLPKYILSQLRQTGDVEADVSPRFLVRNWPPAFSEWSTKGVRDAFFASPQFPRLVDPEAIRRTIARGVSEGQLAYVGKKPKGGYDPFLFKVPLDQADVEISDDVFILTAEEAERHVSPPELRLLHLLPGHAQVKPRAKQSFGVEGVDQYGNKIDTGPIAWSATGGNIGAEGVFTAGTDEGVFIVTATAGTASATASVEVAKEAAPLPLRPEQPIKLVWRGDVAPQKWSQLYMKVLTKLVAAGDVSLNVEVEATLKDGATEQRVEETKAALRELGLSDDVTAE